MRCSFYIFLILLGKVCCLQSQTMDTIINKKHYSYRGYYPTAYSRINLDTEETQTLLCVGNFENGKKTGQWIYFYQDGSVCAKGLYKEGRKIKTWSYYSATQHHDYLKYTSKHEFIDQIFVNESGYLEVRDVTIQNQILYVNGKRKIGRESLFLD